MEDFLMLVGLDANSVILNKDIERRFLLLRPNPNVRIDAGSDVLERIADQVSEYFLQQGAIAPDKRQVPRQVHRCVFDGDFLGQFCEDRFQNHVEFYPGCRKRNVTEFTSVSNSSAWPFNFSWANRRDSSASFLSVMSITTPEMR